MPAQAKTPQQRGRMARGKGQSGELEVVGILRELTGHDVRRRVRQHGGDSDLEGLPGWCVEVKRHASTPPASIAAWWRQACIQAHHADLKAVLFYRADRGAWLAVWHAGHHCKAIPWRMNGDLRDTVTASPETWWRMAGRAARQQGAQPLTT
ncbi:MAG: hypothetical protein BWK72_18360 [Rhodoferax ferrireducens]|uniref:Holliday junction resolvase n=1 Tax=Rhodoferax ferrireducens TaxID=192843 RepID=A0A1W9KPU3_9BURK|nr:MAG: hypothetical protein BWK72_18360 [Rhodoferax ferrireducens]